MQICQFLYINFGYSRLPQRTQYWNSYNFFWWIPNLMAPRWHITWQPLEHKGIRWNQSPVNLPFHLCRDEHSHKLYTLTGKNTLTKNWGLWQLWLLPLIQLCPHSQAKKTPLLSPLRPYDWRASFRSGYSTLDQITFINQTGEKLAADSHQPLHGSRDCEETFDLVKLHQPRKYRRQGDAEPYIKVLGDIHSDSRATTKLHK